MHFDRSQEVLFKILFKFYRLLSPAVAILTCSKFQTPNSLTLVPCFLTPFNYFDFLFIRNAILIRLVVFYDHTLDLQPLKSRCSSIGVRKPGYLGVAGAECRHLPFFSVNFRII